MRTVLQFVAVLALTIPGVAAVAADNQVAREPASSQYTDVVNALQTTKPGRLLTDLGQCANASAGQPSPSLQGGLTINTFIVLPGRGLFFSDVHQTLDEEDQPVTEYVRYNLTPDDQLRVSLTRIVNSAGRRTTSLSVRFRSVPGSFGKRDTSHCGPLLREERDI